ncbi:hypothetical protein BDW42DRAFT_177644 [Aspergillus taichungensis]|uniref:Ysc84 actin-binding domain-containing protein n=1 Tax=Aspergillus taichungensis TaxID=482145 RepID=A0A2J5HIW2_9EURO|nr:hypothetical protein BDW42DRAFT_177644 [Aspergillus taichungensis]
MARGVHNPFPSSLRCESKKACRILESFINPSITGSPGTEIPSKVLQNAKGLVIFTATRAGFLGSVRFGSGVMIARLDNGSWSAPSAIATAGVGFGGLVGFELTDLVFILNDARAVRTFSQMGSLTIGGNVSVATGPVGRSAEFSTGASLKGPASMFTYCKTKGLLGGVSVEAGMILERRAANRKLYNCNITADKILRGGIRPPPEVQPLMDVLYADVFYTDPQNKPRRDPHMPLYGAIEAPAALSSPSSEQQNRGLSPQSPLSDQQLQSPAVSELHAVSTQNLAELPAESPVELPSELPTEGPSNDSRNGDSRRASRQSGSPNPMSNESPAELPTEPSIEPTATHNKVEHSGAQENPSTNQIPQPNRTPPGVPATPSQDQWGVKDHSGEDNPTADPTSSLGGLPTKTPHDKGGRAEQRTSQSSATQPLPP